MANPKHVEILLKGTKAWNHWREINEEIIPDLTGVSLADLRFFHINFSKVDLTEANLNGADFSGSNLSEAILTNCSCVNTQFNNAKLYRTNLSYSDLMGAGFGESNLEGADLSNCDLFDTNFIDAFLVNAKISDSNLDHSSLTDAELCNVNLRKSSLYSASLTDANLENADLFGADLSYANLVRANLRNANLENCRVFGISAWEVNLESTKQSNLVITPYTEPEITVDNVEIAQFIYMLLNNKKIRDVIDNITSKVVLILGRFTKERKSVLDAMRDELRKKNLTPVVFDFDKPSSRDMTETVSTLAHLSRFIIADISDAKSIPQELQAIVPTLAIPVQPLVVYTDKEYGMFSDFRKYPWVLEPYYYSDLDQLLKVLESKVICPAERKAQQLSSR